jgi:hypothetical protein
MTDKGVIVEVRIERTLDYNSIKELFNRKFTIDKTEQLSFSNQPNQMMYRSVCYGPSSKEHILQEIDDFLDKIKHKTDKEKDVEGGNDIHRITVVGD